MSGGPWLDEDHSPIARALARSIQPGLHFTNQGGNGSDGKESHVLGRHAIGLTMKYFPALGQGLNDGLLLLKAIILTPVGEAINRTARIDRALGCCS